MTIKLGAVLVSTCAQTKSPSPPFLTPFNLTGGNKYCLQHVYKFTVGSSYLSGGAWRKAYTKSATPCWGILGQALPENSAVKVWHGAFPCDLRLIRVSCLESKMALLSGQKRKRMLYLFKSCPYKAPKKLIFCGLNYKTLPWDSPSKIPNLSSSNLFRLKVTVLFLEAEGSSACVCPCVWGGLWRVEG